MNRGSGRQTLFLDDADREDFLALLAECRARWGVATHAAVLMSNHFHLLVEDGDRQLSRAMRHLHGVFTQRFNRRHGRDGPLMRGRFRSRLVGTERYLTEVVRYIHANPVEAGLVTRAADWPWSSHRHYLADERPEWLDTAGVMARFGGDTSAGRAALDRFVHERMSPEVRALVDARRWLPVLADPEDLDATRTALRATPLVRDPRVRRFAAPTPGQVAAVIAEHLGRPVEEVARGRRGKRSLGRQLAVLIGARYLPATCAEVGAALGMSASGVSSRAMQVEKLLSRDPTARQALDDVLTALGLDHGPARRE